MAVSDPECPANLSTKMIAAMATELPLYMKATKMSTIWQPAIIIAGLFGNVLIVLVMLQKSHRWSSCSNYIAVLAVSDSIALIRKSMDHLYPFFDIKYTVTSCSGWVYIALAACQYSMLLVMCMTVDRLISVKYPSSSSTYCNPKRARKVMTILLLVALVFNIPHIFFTSPLADGKYCAAFGESDTWSLVYGWLQVIVNFIIPVICLTTMTIVILKTLRQNQKSTEKLRAHRTSETSQTSGVNFVTHIINDGLFNYVLSFIAESFKYLDKQKSNSSVEEVQPKDNCDTGSEGDGTVNHGYKNSADDICNQSMDCPDGKAEVKHSEPGDRSQTANQAYTGQANPNFILNISDENLDISAGDSSDHLSDPKINCSDMDDKNISGLSAGGTGPNSLERETLDEKFREGENYTEDEEASTHSQRLRRQTSKKRSNQLTVMLFLVVFFFVILTVPQHIRYIIYNLNFVDRWECAKTYSIYVMVFHFSNKAYFTNCAVNFYLYICSSSMFRRSLKDLFTCCCRKKAKKTVEEPRLPTISERCDVQVTSVRVSVVSETTSAV